MAFRLRVRARFTLAFACTLPCALGGTGIAHGQVFVVGEKTATADIATDFRPTRVELPSKPLNELGRRELIRDLEAEQGFAHRALPVSADLVLMANGNLTPGPDAYREAIYKKGQAVAAGDRVIITAISFKADRIILDLNGGPYLKHRFLRHIELNNAPVVYDDGEAATGSRVTLVFEGGIPDVSAPVVKALLDPVIDFGVKTSGEAYADTLPVFLKEAITQHDILVGMNRRMVLAAAGAPENKIRELVPGSDTRHYEEWIYGHLPQTVRFVRLEGDRVTQVRVAALGQPIAIHDTDEMNGYLNPDDTREVAMGDSPVGADPDHPAGPPPTLRKPGEPDVELPNGANRVQFPVPAKDKPAPIPADPNRSADSAPLPGSASGSGPGSGPGPAAPDRVN